ncbi:hypothetical protein SOVF_059820 isoform B [Spinacia oleracea]|nr:hypothetical protein SOVF_059820 isoform B [Spinacia oleracea]
MSVTNHQLIAFGPLSSSSSSFFAHSNITSSRAQIVGVRVKNVGVVKCVATPPAQQTAYTSKVSRNPNMAKLEAGYLFPEIGRRRNAHMLKYPDAKVISLGIGDTTEPIPDIITSAMAKGVFVFMYGYCRELMISPHSTVIAVMELNRVKRFSLYSQFCIILAFVCFS